MIQLRPYQLDIIERTRAALRRVRAVLIQAPCGSGKTALTANIIANAAKKQKCAWFVCHRRELIKQSMTAFDRQEISYGVCAAGFRANTLAGIQIASINTLARRHERYQSPDLIVFDECHHMGAATWRELYLKFPKAKIIGLSATPARLDGQGLNEFFGELIAGPQPHWLIEQGFLSPYRLFVPPQIDVSALHTRMGDYARNELVDAVDKPRITGSAVAHYLQHAPGKKAVTFCCSIEHSQHVAEQFREAGIHAVHLDGCADSQVRDGVLADFAAGKIKVLSSVDLLIEGFDLPGIECAILLRPTQSLNIYIQQIGRAMRTAPGKTECIIFDHAGNSSRHGRPDDDRVWTLQGREIKRRGANEEPSIRICQKCFSATKSPAIKCSNCGMEFPVQAREIEEIEGELIEIAAREAAAKQEKKSEVYNAKTLADLVKIGTARGYKNANRWAMHILDARRTKEEIKQKTAEEWNRETDFLFNIDRQSA